MFSKKEAAELRKEFWTVFGKYMSPVLSSEGEKINWINYKTGIKGLQFKMEAAENKASLSIVITQHDQLEQKILFDKLETLKPVLYDCLHDEWTWLLHTNDQQGKIVSRIFKEITGVNILRKEDWPVLISFFKPGMIALDEFWNSVKYSFEEWH